MIVRDYLQKSHPKFFKKALYRLCITIYIYVFSDVRLLRELHLTRGQIPTTIKAKNTWIQTSPKNNTESLLKVKNRNYTPRKFSSPKTFTPLAKVPKHEALVKVPKF